MEIDLNQQIPGCRNFSWGEALYLPRWQIHVMPTDEEIATILHFAPKAQRVRDFLGLPMLVTSWLRPPVYNKLIGGAEFSYHMTGGAMDFRCPMHPADEIRHKIAPMLEEFGLRMENLPNANWVHIDSKEPGENRFFKP